MKMDTDDSAVEHLELPEISEYDKKQYRAIRLTNEMKVILVHDDKVQENEKHECWPACALNITVGSLSDPSGLEGLATFLDHMMNFSGDTEIKRLLLKCGEDLESCTRRNDTRYQFKSTVETFDEALRCFSHLFKNPLNSRESISDARESVKWTYEPMYESWGEHNLFSWLGNVGHPSQRFPCVFENLDRVDDDTLNQRVEEFKSLHYSAHRMNLCLQTHLSLDVMQDLVVKHFSSVPSNKLLGFDVTAFTHENAYQSKFHENVYFVKPHGKGTQIPLCWCIPPQPSASETGPYNFLQHIIDDRAGLTHYLRQKNLARQVVSVMSTSPLFSLFFMRMKPIDGDEDLTHLDEILEVVFSYLRLHLQILKQSRSLGQLYQDFVNVKSLPLSVGKRPVHNAEILARNLSDYPMRTKCDSKAIQDAIDVLNGGKFNVMVICRAIYEEKIKFEAEQLKCGVNFVERKMPDKWISFWNNPKLFAEIKSPAPNPYIATDFTILHDGTQSTPKYPTKVYESDVSELWHRLDDAKFATPTARCWFYFKIPVSTSPGETNAMKSLLFTILSDHHKDQLHWKESQIIFFMEDVEDGIVLKVFGPNHNLHLAVHDIVKDMENFVENVTEEELDVVMRNDIEYYENYFTPNLYPEYYAKPLRATIIQTWHASYYEKYLLTKSFKTRDVQQFCRQFFKQLKIIGLIQGNMSEETSKSIVQTMEADLGCGKIDDMRAADLQARKLPLGSNYILLNAFDRADYESATVNYYQIGPKSLRTKLLIELLGKIYENSLSKSKALPDAYTIWEPTDDCDILGYNIIVRTEEEKNSAEAVDEYIEKLRRELVSLIGNMSPEEFQEAVSLVAKEKIPDNNDFYENWLELLSGEHLFDRLDLERGMLSTLTQSELLQCYHEHSGPNERKLSIQFSGYTKATGLIERDSGAEDEIEINKFPSNPIYGEPRMLRSGTIIKDIGEFIASLDIYQL